jgi:aldose 1-epimerase
VTSVDLVRLAGDELEVELLPELGCRLHRLRAFGTDLLRTPADPATHAADPFFWGAYVMAPWTNRVSAAPMAVAGRTVDVPSNFPDGTAIHGQVAAAPWERTGEASFRVEHGGDGWPWAYAVTADVAVEGPRLRLAYRLANRSDGPMPAGLGLHPWWVRPVEVGLVARTVHPHNADPDAAPAAAHGPWALDGGPPRPGLDASWLDVERGAVTLAWPEGGITASLRIGADGPAHVAVATPDDVDATAVEPVTHVPWALDRAARGLPGGIRLIRPGEALGLELELVVARAG